MSNGEQQSSFVARAGNQQEGDIHNYTRGIYAEAALRGRPEEWVGITHVLENRLKSGKWGETRDQVMQKSLNAVRKKSSQYKLTGNMDKMNQYEQNVFNQIKQAVTSVLKDGAPDNTGGADHYENIEQFGMPPWGKDMTPTTKLGNHTFFKSKSQPPPTIRGDEGGGL